MSSELIQTNGAGKLSKLILLLSSDVDGEIVAAARAIGRTLQAQGRDWHDLAHQVAHPTTPTPQWRQAAAECLRWPELLSPREREFLTSIRCRATLSEKQACWLADIIDRVRS